MNFVKSNIILIVIITGFCVPATCMEERTLSNERALIISQPDPALAGVNKLNITIFQPDTEPNIDGLTRTELEAKIIDQINTVDANLISESPGNILNIPELRIYINALKLEDTERYVFHIQTSLARNVHLTESKSPVLKVNVWRSNPAMQTISKENVTEEIANLVSEQVDFFIHAYQAANPPGQKTIPEEPAESSDESLVAENRYVASKSSNVFHRPNCRWAKNISPDNLVEYKNRDEAIKVGKRPCKSCRP